jgi:hypothetical protein
MIKLTILGVVFAVTAIVGASGVGDAYPPGYNTNPITVVTHDIPKAYWDSVDRCTRDRSNAERSRCIGSLPYDTSTHCLRVEIWYVDGTVLTTRNDCGY